MKKIKENWFEEWANNELNNVCCPFCGQKVNGEISNNLTLSKIQKIVKQIDVVLKEINEKRDKPKTI